MNTNDKIYELAIRISCCSKMAARGGDHSMNACLKIANDANKVDYLDKALKIMRERKNYFSK